jgi:signal transduction histidine kinase
MAEDSPLTTATVSGPRGVLKRRKQLERDLEHITEEMYRRNRELADTNRTLSLLRSIDTLVLESQASLKEVCEQITHAITDSTDYPFAALLTQPSHGVVKELELYGWSIKDGQDPNLFGTKTVPRVLIKDLWDESAERSKLISIETIEDSTVARLLDSSEVIASSIKKKLPLKSLYVVKLVSRQHLVGILVAGFYSTVAQVSAADTLMLDRLSEPVGIALDNRLLFEENRRVLLQLRKSNEKLKALDETKDDFISMASHQLRTPLTSVKGYLSMVLEGDAGKLTALERKMLTQAFTSSQRMVYLIADLLNVSRLKTGKFIIEPVATNLATMVEEELRQLKETAESRSVELLYDKPRDFPEVQLDETKTRQVIMNFVDNAIYYTPAGGHIKILVEDKPASVELRVVDDGMGVPKAEQHHLFTKFYRAGNARKARPDGTGLGLFMAKKVIAAQGGAVLFESQEGKGSTFGFAFSKAKLAAQPTTPPVQPENAIAK